MIYAISYLLLSINNAIRQERLEFNLKRSNHPASDPKSEAYIINFIKDELSKGFILPIPKDKIS